MIRLWLHGLARKVLRGRVLQRKSRPALSLRACPRFDTLEDRTVASTTYLEAPEPPPTPTASIPVAEAPADADPDYADPSYQDDAGAAKPYDPGLDQLLEDVLEVPVPTQPQPGSSDLTLVSDDAGQPRAPHAPFAGGARPGNKAVGSATGSHGLHAADPLPPRGVQAASAVPGAVRGPRVATGNLTKQPARVAKVEYVTSDAPPPGVAEVTVARLGKDLIDRAARQVNEAVPQGQAAALETSIPRRQPPPPTGDLPDGSLLERYAATREETAFAALVQRHEQLVLGVCRRVLGDSHAALDAFQATFLVLARRASMLDKNGSLAGWLYKVAYHLALRLREVAARQRRREKEAARGRSSRAASADHAALEKQEIREALTEELERLPDKYRVPLVLCYFDGRTHDEAARAIGLPRGSMAKRIGEGLERLRERLNDRGFMP